MAGRRRGMGEGTRTGLYWQISRLLADLRPRWLVLENVPGLLSIDGGRTFGTILGDLAGHGYGWSYRVLDAQHFGVAQRRRRVFVVGCLGDPARAAQVLLEPEGRVGDPAPRVTSGTGVAGAATSGTERARGGPEAPLATAGRLRLAYDSGLRRSGTGTGTGSGDVERAIRPRRPKGRTSTPRERR